MHQTISAKVFCEYRLNGFPIVYYFKEVNGRKYYYKQDSLITAKILVELFKDFLQVKYSLC